MTTVGFIGLGIMGKPMAKRLVAAGFDVVGFNRSRPALDELTAAGGRMARSVEEAVADADIAVTMLPDSPDVQAVAGGDRGVLATLRTGSLYIDCSSIRPDTSRELAALGRERGIGVVDAPVSGGESGAVQGVLSVMAGGAVEDVERARPVLSCFGPTVVRVGEAGSGQTVKAANQLMVAGTIELVAEALVFLEAHGVELESAVEVLAGGLAGNAILDRKAAGMLERAFDPGFRVELHHKDLGIVTAAAREVGVAIPLGAHVAGLMAALRAEGLGDRDHTALLLLVEQLSGRGGPRP